MFSKKEIAWLTILASAGLISYLSGLDYWAADALGRRAPHGYSLFFSTQYFVLFMVVSMLVAFLRNRRAAAALALSVILLFLMQTAFSHFAPRARPPQAMHIGDGLLNFIKGSGASSSFFSGHSAAVAAACTVLLLLDIHPLMAAALGVPILLSRILLVQHYISDVFGGVIFGYVTAKVLFRSLIMGRSL